MLAIRMKSRGVIARLFTVPFFPLDRREHAIEAAILTESSLKMYLM